MASFLTDSESNMNLGTHTQFQVPGSSKQDRGKSWTLDNNRIYAVADGHGVYGHIYAETAINILDNMIPNINWSKDDLTDDIASMYDSIEQSCIDTISDKGGGTTLSFCVIREGRDIWTSNVGDSDIVRFNKETKEHILLTADHSPINIDEYKRINAEFPNTLFKYDKVNKSVVYRHHDIFSKVDGEIVKNPIPKSNVYYKNVMCEFATTIGDGSDYLAVTRSIGDFHQKSKYGVTHKPSINKYSSLQEDEFLVCASDGLWDCWKFDEIVDTFKDRPDNWEDLHKSKATSLFGSSIDDTFCFFIN